MHGENLLAVGREGQTLVPRRINPPATRCENHRHTGAHDELDRPGIYVHRGLLNSIGAQRKVRYPWVRWNAPGTRSFLSRLAVCSMDSTAPEVDPMVAQIRRKFRFDVACTRAWVRDLSLPRNW